jgi:hypothetical protein
MMNLINKNDLQNGSRLEIESKILNLFYMRSSYNSPSNDIPLVFSDNLTMLPAVCRRDITLLNRNINKTYPPNILSAQETAKNKIHPMKPTNLALNTLHIPSFQFHFLFLARTCSSESSLIRYYSVKTRNLYKLTTSPIERMLASWVKSLALQILYPENSTRSRTAL